MKEGFHFMGSDGGQGGDFTITSKALFRSFADDHNGFGIRRTKLKQIFTSSYSDDEVAFDFHIHPPPPSQSWRS